MGNIFSNKSFMNRYFSSVPKSGGPAKTSDGPAKPKLERKEDKLKKTAKQLADPDVGGKKWSRKLAKYRKTKKQIEEIESKSDGPAKKTKGERQKGRADKKAARQQARAEKRIDRNEKKQDRISKNTSKSTDPEVVKSGQARIERAKKRVKKNKTVSPDYVSKKDKANIAKNKKNKPGLKNPPPSSQTKTPLSAGDGGDDFNKLLSPAKTDPLLSDMQEALQNPKVYKKGKRKGLRKAKKLAKK